MPEIAPGYKDGTDLIAEERRRQIEVEGFSPEDHDTEYDDEGSPLAAAAIAYIGSASKIDVLVRHDVRAAILADDGRADPEDRDDEAAEAPVVAFYDPFPPKWLGTFGDGVNWDKRKKHSRLRQLVIAGALIAAEIDRLQRSEAGLNDGP